MKIYKSCNTLPIQSFYNIFEDDDFRNMVVGFDKENDTYELSNKKLKKFEDIFRDIYYEFAELTENHKLRALLKKQFLIETWEFIYKMIVNAMYLYCETGEVEFLKSINRLNEDKYRIDLSKPVEVELKKLVLKMKGLKMKLSIFKGKIKKKKLTDEKPPVVDLDKDALFFERYLDLKRPINPKTETVRQWINLENAVKAKTKLNKK